MDLAQIDFSNSLFQPTLHFALVLGLGAFVIGSILGWALWRKDRSRVRNLVEVNKSLRQELQRFKKGGQPVAGPAGERESVLESQS